MSDTDQSTQPSQPAPQVPPTTTDGQKNQKSPLDILEELLADSKKNSAAGTATDQAGNEAAVAAPTGGGGEAPAEAASQATNAPGEMTPEERAALDAKIAQQQIEDQQTMQQTLAGLAEVSTTPQYQARVQQQAEEIEKQKQHQQEQDGHEIRQLKHTTI
jgi:hypothetical protein